MEFSLCNLPNFLKIDNVKQRYLYHLLHSSFEFHNIHPKSVKDELGYLKCFPGF